MHKQQLSYSTYSSISNRAKARDYISNIPRINRNMKNILVEISYLYNKKP